MQLESAREPTKKNGASECQKAGGLSATTTMAPASSLATEQPRQEAPAGKVIVEQAAPAERSAERLNGNDTSQAPASSSHQAAADSSLDPDRLSPLKTAGDQLSRPAAAQKHKTSSFLDASSGLLQDKANEILIEPSSFSSDSGQIRVRAIKLEDADDAKLTIKKYEKMFSSTNASLIEAAKSNDLVKFFDSYKGKCSCPCPSSD